MSRFLHGKRHHDRGGPSSDTTSSREPEITGQALRRQAEDRCQMEEAKLVADLPTGPSEPISWPGETSEKVSPQV